MTHPDPVTTMLAWYDEAVQRGEPQPDAMALATATTDGAPSVRFVLYKGVAEGGLVFFTNFESRKSSELVANPRASVAFHWRTLGRQVRVEGRVARLSDAAADEYFRARPVGAQLGAWASPQSSPIDGGAWLTAEVERVRRRFAGSAIPRPDHWGGYVIRPDVIELWRSRQDRLHQREQFSRTDGGWRRTRLAP